MDKITKREIEELEILAREFIIGYANMSKEQKELYYLHKKLQKRLNILEIKRRRIINLIRGIEKRLVNE